MDVPLGSNPKPKTFDGVGPVPRPVRDMVLRDAACRGTACSRTPLETHRRPLNRILTSILCAELASPTFAATADARGATGLSKDGTHSRPTSRVPPAATKESVPGLAAATLVSPATRLGRRALSRVERRSYERRCCDFPADPSRWPEGPGPGSTPAPSGGMTARRRVEMVTTTHRP